MRGKFRWTRGRPGNPGRRARVKAAVSSQRTLDSRLDLGRATPGMAVSKVEVRAVAYRPIERPHASTPHPERRQRIFPRLPIKTETLVGEPVRTGTAYLAELT